MDDARLFCSRSRNALRRAFAYENIRLSFASATMLVCLRAALHASEKIRLVHNAPYAPAPHSHLKFIQASGKKKY